MRAKQPPAPPIATGSSGATGARERDSSGRFQPGNQTSKLGGNPQIRKLAKLQKAVRQSVTATKLKRVLDGLLSAAACGDHVAARVYLERALGKPAETQTLVGETLQLPDVTTTDGYVAAVKAIQGAFSKNEVSLEVAEKLTRLVTEQAQAGFVEQLAARVAELEARGNR